MSRDVHLEHLVLSPFREAVEKARTALENAEAAEDDAARSMQRAAKSLLGKGERALKKIEPLCERLLDEYGVSFVDAVKENKEIAKHREQLNDLLWDLDDYAQADSFDEEAYGKLDTVLRMVTLKIADVLATMKVEKPAVTPAEEVRRRGSMAASERGHRRSVIETEPVGTVDKPRDADVNTTRRESAGSGGAAGGVVAVSQPDQPIETIHPENIPPEPDANLWNTTEPAPDIEAEENLERRPPVEEEENRDLVSPLTPDNNVKSPVFYHPGRPNEEAAPDLRASHASWSSFHSAGGQDVARNSVGSFGSLTASRLSLTPASAAPLSQGPHGSPVGSRLSLTPATSHSSGRWSGSLSMPQPGLEVVKILNDGDGLLPVLPQTTDAEPENENTSVLDCKIDKDSSFSHFRGFCEGAQEALRQGNFGIKKNRKGATVAKCRYCQYELDWGLIDADVKGFADANYTTSSVSFRLRFLAKSHLPARQPSDRLYACHFCIYAGQTPRPSDATVFFSQKDLCTHIARHPRPLPHIFLLTVLDTDLSPEVPEHLANNYDVLLARPPIPSSVPGALETANLPCAVATESFWMTIYGLRMPPDRAETLQFVVGQKIVGIEFPARYEGRWAVGWADDEKGVFPVECVRLVPPPRRDWRPGSWGSGRSSGGKRELTAVARWKMSPPSSLTSGKGSAEGDAGERWLKFGKGEVITGISFPYEEHWCWSGRNAKGKWGIFPRAFIQPKSLRGPSEEGLVGESSIGKNSIWTWRSKKGRGEPGYAAEEGTLGLGRRSSRTSDY